MDRFAFVNGINLHYLDHPGGEPLLVLLPGLTANAHCFDGLIEAGLSPRFRVLAVDLRGRGQSDKPPTGYTIGEHAADILGLLDHLGLQQAVVGGHSFGALVSIYLAAHFPERIEKLILLDAAARLHPRTRELIQPSIDRLNKVWPSMDAYLAAMKAMPFLDGFWDGHLEDFYRGEMRTNADGTVQALTSGAAVLEAADKGLLIPWDELVKRIKQPALMVNAPAPYGPPGAPPLISAEQAQETVSAIAGCRYVRVPGNHLTMLFGENAAHTAKAIAEFLATTDHH
jgi:pimeloyl-ACP methyl ester carboxylesterase